MSSTATTPDLLAAARAIAPVAREHASQSERERRLAPEVFDAMCNAGLYRMLLPREHGGGEASLPEAMRVFEEVARADGSAGWCLMIGTVGNAFTAWLQPGVARQVCADSRLVIAGMFGATGTAERVEGGWRVSGHWPFMSGIGQSSWSLGTCRVQENGEPVLGAAGNPLTMMFVAPTSAGRVIENWEVSGLCGTGSHDFAVDDLFVPEERSLHLFRDRPVHPSPLYRLAYQAQLWLYMAPVPLGIARGALDDLAELAGRKTPSGGKALLRDLPYTQHRYAEAEVELRSARAFLYETAADAWEHALAGEEYPTEKLMVAGLAARKASLTAQRVTEVAHELAGATAIRLEHSLQRRFRDAHAASQHVAFNPGIYENAGRTLLNQAG